MKKLKRDRQISFQLLDRKHLPLLNSFTCSDDELDSYLKNDAFDEQSKNFSRVFLGISNFGELVSFFTLSATSVDKIALPKSNRPPYPLAPVVLIGRLAVDEKFQKQGFGKKTLTQILNNYIKACSFVGSTALVVEAYEESVSFYTKYRFKKIKTKKRHGKKITTLYLLTETIVSEA